ncbi:CBS domain-containing protein [archaeon]|nr:MAG: CBS domain-containing protein [archaeon]
MKISQVMVKNVVRVNHDDTISKALELMGKNCVHQVAVVEDDLFLGMASIKDILNSRCNPTDTVSDVMKKIATLREEQDLDDAISTLLRTGYRALPVVDVNELKGIVSETDLIKRIEFLMEINVDHFAADVAVVNESDSVSKALSLMRGKNISRVVVTDSKNNVKGCVDSVSLISLLSQPTGSVRPASYTEVEKESLANFAVRDYMRRTCVMERANFSLKDAIKNLQKFEEIVLVDKNWLFGIITPKDVLELRDYEELPLQVSHYQSIGKFDATRVNEKLASFVKKLQKMDDVQKMFVYFDTVNQNGKTHYFSRARLIAGDKIFIAHADAWGLDAAVQDLEDNLEKQFAKVHGKKIKGSRAAYRKIKEK